MSELSWIEIIYWAATIIGGTLFVLRLILMFTVGDGMDGDLDHGMDLHTDAAGHAGGDLADAGQSAFSFNLLSLQGMTAFFTMFGLIGLALLKAGVNIPLTMLGGVAAGLFTVFVISLIFSQVGRLQSEGNLDLRNAIGENGTVYLRVPPGGSGRVEVPVQGAMRVLDAVAAGDEGLPSGTKVRVTGVKDKTTLIIERN